MPSSVNSNGAQNEKKNRPSDKKINSQMAIKTQKKLFVQSDVDWSNIMCFVQSILKTVFAVLGTFLF